MATQKKGCGLLITALIILLVGGGIAAYLGMSAVSTGKEFGEKIEKSLSFGTPSTLNYTAEADEEVTVWLTSDGSTDLAPISIEFTELESGINETAGTSGTSSSFGNQHLVAKYEVEKGKVYRVKATGIADGHTFRVANVDSNAVISMIGKGFGAVATIGGFGFLALIFGIIGLVKFMGSKKEQPAPPAAGPPAMG